MKRGLIIHTRAESVVVSVGGVMESRSGLGLELKVQRADRQRLVWIVDHGVVCRMVDGAM